MSLEVARSRPNVNPANGDPNIVVLAKFEDAPLSLPSLTSFPVDRRTSLPENLHSLNLSGGSRGSSLPSGRRNDSVTQGLRDERLMVHYRGFISKRMFPIGKGLLVDRPMQDDPIVAEARDFPPVSYKAPFCLVPFFLGQASIHYTIVTTPPHLEFFNQLVGLTAFLGWPLAPRATDSEYPDHLLTR
jgi:hypothetical protein